MIWLWPTTETLLTLLIYIFNRSPVIKAIARGWAIPFHNISNRLVSSVWLFVYFASIKVIPNQINQKITFEIDNLNWCNLTFSNFRRDGHCPGCGLLPQAETQKFQFLKLSVPESSSNVTLRSLIDGYTSESAEAENIRYLRVIKINNLLLKK